MQPVRSNIPTSTRKVLRCCLISTFGREGYLRVLHTAQHLLQWLACVAILEVGTMSTLDVGEVLGVLSVSSLSAVSIHHGIAGIGMFGFLISQLLYEIEFFVRRFGQIRDAWKKKVDS
jgi:hypothetical protein